MMPVLVFPTPFKHNRNPIQKVQAIHLTNGSKKKRKREEEKKEKKEEEEEEEEEEETPRSNRRRNVWTAFSIERMKSRLVPPFSAI